MQAVGYSLEVLNYQCKQFVKLKTQTLETTTEVVQLVSTLGIGFESTDLMQLFIYITMSQLYKRYAYILFCIIICSYFLCNRLGSKIPHLVIK